MHWIRRLEPAARDLETRVETMLAGRGVAAHGVDAATLWPPGSVLTGEGSPYRVFTPFWRALQRLGEPADPEATPTVRSVTAWPASDELVTLGLLPRVDWAGGLRDTWTPGEGGAAERLQAFGARAADYDDDRDRPDLEGTSRLSPHLRFGELGPRQVWHAARAAAGRRAQPWLRQLAWREFACHLLHGAPHTASQPLRPEFEHFPWRRRRGLLRDWQRGRTGLPIVDAGMRQLCHAGWMHNRVRMVVASFLVKDLLQPWQEGARRFWDTLVDADLANNTLGWQWTAGCGADAAPYFRVFNPVSQGQRFDPDGAYVRHWVPELDRLPARWIHRPWEAPEAVLNEAGVDLGQGYPPPMLDHGEARERALEAYADMRAQARGAA